MNYKIVILRKHNNFCNQRYRKYQPTTTNYCNKNINQQQKRKSKPACDQRKGILEPHAGTNKHRVIMGNYSQHQWTAVQGVVASPFAMYLSDTYC